MPADPEAAAGEGDAAPPAGRAVLVVAADRSSREGLRQALLHGGLAADAAADAWQAIQRLRERRYDAAVIDLDLPASGTVALQGWDLVRISRGYSPAIAVILVADEDDAAVRRTATTLGVDACLEKPISPAHVRGLIERLTAPGAPGREDSR